MQNNYKKKELRQLYKQKRQALSLAEFEQLNSAVFMHFTNLDFAGISYLHIFLPIEAKREINTWQLVDWLAKNHPSINRVIPKADFGSGAMTHFLHSSNENLIVSDYGIPEPVFGEQIAPLLIDMIIIPLLTVDVTGHRIGYGRGFYDRFLTDCRKDVKTVGLSLFEPVEPFADTEAHDYRLQKCITPTGIITF